MTSIKTIVIGPIYHSLGLNTLQFIQNGRIAVSGNGCIVSAGQNIDDDMFEETSSAQIIKLEEGQFLIPGFVDSMYLFINLAHIHGPQYVFTGTGYDLPLLKWLETYTFPRESAFKDVPYAIDNYTKVVKKSLSFGRLFYLSQGLLPHATLEQHILIPQLNLRK
jgi:guanine deaminase